MRRERMIKTIFAGLVITTGALTTTSYAQGVNSCSDSDSCLKAIMQNTYETLGKVNTLPDYLNQLGQFAASWLAVDDTTSTTEMQANFANSGAFITQAMSGQYTDPVQLAADLYGQPKTNFTTPSNRPSILDVLPNVNDITYSSVIGFPPVVKAPVTPYNYIKVASGMSIPHTMPGLTWQGKSDDINRYRNYYNTVMAVESFNGYILNNQYTNPQSFTTAQASLINQASGSTWLAQVATEELGKVLRQILMFESQSYVLLSQMAQTQRQQLAAATMTNSLLILNNQQLESYLSAKAQGLKPTG